MIAAAPASSAIAAKPAPTSISGTEFGDVAKAGPARKSSPKNVVVRITRRSPQKSRGQRTLFPSIAQDNTASTGVQPGAHTQTVYGLAENGRSLKLAFGEMIGEASPEAFTHMDFIKGSGGLYYLLALVVSAIVIEHFIPWRKGVKVDFARWLRNASMALYGTILLSLVPVIAAYAGAVTAASNNIGLMNQFETPLLVKLVISILILDLMSYGQHRVLHKWYFFWRAHRTHHTDAHIDATTSLRFHPLESLFRAVIELGVVFAFAIPPEGILLSFLVHVLANTFTHTNIALPLSVDKIVARFITTPHIHRLHHSVSPDHQFSNFGTAFTIWDQIFGTYLGPEHLRENEQFGVDGEEGMVAETFANLALDPFRTPANAEIPKPVAPTTPPEQPEVS